MKQQQKFWTPLAVFRMACCAVALTLWIDGVVIDAVHTFEPYVVQLRWLLGIGLPLGFCTLTFVSETVRRNATPMMIVIALLVMVYAALVARETHLSADAAFGSVMLLCGSCILFDHPKYAITNAAAGTVVMLGITSQVVSPEVSYPKYALTLIAFVGFFLSLNLISNKLRLAAQKPPQRCLAQRTKTPPSN